MVMAYIVMAYIVMANIVMAYMAYMTTCSVLSNAILSFVDSYGLYTYMAYIYETWSTSPDANAPHAGLGTWLRHSSIRSMSLLYLSVSVRG